MNNFSYLWKRCQMPMQWFYNVLQRLLKNRAAATLCLLLFRFVCLIHSFQTDQSGWCEFCKQREYGFFVLRWFSLRLPSFVAFCRRIKRSTFCASRTRTHAHTFPCVPLRMPVHSNMRLRACNVFDSTCRFSVDGCTLRSFYSESSFYVCFIVVQTLCEVVE